jgi:GNAT superfamily N-acetyltransferase
MNFRSGIPADIPAIVDLLKSTLGEELIPKSEKLWNWKHLQNPFGQSPIILAEDKGQLVGLRAFLPWEWEFNGKTYMALRAVDTAVHPDYQGKGIFTKLTTALLQQSQEAGYSFIFNTPNNKSLPGYLKMGWEKVGKLPVQLAFNSFKSPPLQAENPELNKLKFEQLIQTAYSYQKGIRTKLSADFLLWRYGDCPIATYGMATDAKTYLLLYRLKSSASKLELRIVEVLGLNQGILPDTKHLKNEIKKIRNLYRVNFISCSPGLPFSILPLIGSLPALKIGPVLTVRNLNLETNHQDFLQIGNWGSSLGDMEIF